MGKELFVVKSVRVVCVSYAHKWRHKRHPAGIDIPKATRKKSSQHWNRYLFDKITKSVEKTRVSPCNLPWFWVCLSDIHHAFPRLRVICGHREVMRERWLRCEIW